MSKSDLELLEGVTLADFLDALFSTGVACADGPGGVAEA